jgi:hypothetical protein
MMASKPSGQEAGSRTEVDLRNVIGSPSVIYPRMIKVKSKKR